MLLSFTFSSVGSNQRQHFTAVVLVTVVGIHLVLSQLIQ